MIHVAVIGFGEAGQAFAADKPWRAYDIDPAKTRTASLSEVLEGAATVLCLVTADQALVAAQEAARHMAAGALFCDMNSVSPDTKKEAANLIEASGARYVDVAVMSPVHPERRATPLLLSGPHADAGLETLLALGFSNARVVGPDVGRASTIKMLRSVMYKGMEALTAECFLACEKAGVTDEVLSSFGTDWAASGDYRLDRMLVHGLRRAAEMDESAKTLLALGISPALTKATANWQQALGDLQISPMPEGLKAKLAAILERMS
jgi:3-hydroxyisobutyrate dehydrogenase-like beta-hydroxyacid dehydrogenase